MAGYSKNSDGTYSVNYEDERFQQIENEKVQEIQKTENMYDNMITNSDKYYQAQIEASKEWADKQSELQQQKTDLLLEQTQQQKDKAEKDYIKEQKGAYQDYLKQTDAYGVNAERLAASGLANSGYSETSKVRMYNAYQNRYATARESYNQAVLNYDNAMKEAILANNEQLATISFNALQQQLELSLQGFQYKNELLLTKEQQVNQTKENYYNKYQNVLAQINSEINRQMQIDEANRQYELELQKILENHNQWMKEFEANEAQREKEFALKEKQYALQEKQAERDYQLALAAERRAAAAAYNGSIIDNSLAGDDEEIENLNNPSTGTLSEAGSKLQKQMSNLIRNMGGMDIGSMNVMGNTAKKSAIRQIDSAYAKGKITDTDVRLIISNLGLE